MRAEIGFTFVAGAIVGAVIRHLMVRPPFDDDRPAMIIKNGSITFENEGKTIGWKGDSDDFYPDQLGGKKVTWLIAEATNADTGCALMKGDKLVVTYIPEVGAGEDFEVRVSGNGPKIKHKGKLNHNEAEKELWFGTEKLGRISKVTLGGTTCTFSQPNGKITIWYL